WRQPRQARRDRQGGAGEQGGFHLSLRAALRRAAGADRDRRRPRRRPRPRGRPQGEAAAPRGAEAARPRALSSALPLRRRDLAGWGGGLSTPGGGELPPLAPYSRYAGRTRQSAPRTPGSTPRRARAQRSYHRRAPCLRAFDERNRPRASRRPPAQKASWGVRG